MDGQEQRNKQRAGLKKPWEPGVSGNPAGRPKGKSLLSEIREVLDDDELLGKKNPGGRSNRRLLAETAIMHAIKGRSAYFREIMERLFGKVPFRVEQQTPDDGNGLGIPDHVAAAGLRAMLEEAAKLQEPDE